MIKLSKEKKSKKEQVSGVNENRKNEIVFLASEFKKQELSEGNKDKFKAKREDIPPPCSSKSKTSADLAMASFLKKQNTNKNKNEE